MNISIPGATRENRKRIDEMMEIQFGESKRANPIITYVLYN